jgi:hypothetical protein
LLITTLTQLGCSFSTKPAPAAEPVGGFTDYCNASRKLATTARRMPAHRRNVSTMFPRKTLLSFDQLNAWQSS